MLNPFSSPIRPALGGNCGAVSAAHPVAVAAGQQMLSTGGNAVDALLAPHARLGLAVALAPAVRIAGHGCRVDPGLAAARDIQKPRLLAGGAVDWPLMSAKVGSTFRQPELARTLERIASEGREGLYAGPVGAEMIARVAAGLCRREFCWRWPSTLGRVAVTIWPSAITSPLS
jgi:gamma-glutamyltranspeptidase